MSQLVQKIRKLSLKSKFDKYKETIKSSAGEIEVLSDKNVKAAIEEEFRELHRKYVFQIYDDALFLLIRKYQIKIEQKVVLTKGNFRAVMELVNTQLNLFIEHIENQRHDFITESQLAKYLENNRSIDLDEKSRHLLISIFAKQFGDVLNFSEFFNMVMFLDTAEEEFLKTSISDYNTRHLNEERLRDILAVFNMSAISPSERNLLKGSSEISLSKFLSILLEKKNKSTPLRLMRKKGSRVTNIRNDVLAARSFYEIYSVQNITLQYGSDDESPYKNDDEFDRSWIFMIKGDTNSGVSAGDLRKRIQPEEVPVSEEVITIPVKSFKVIFLGDLLSFYGDAAPNATNDIIALLESADLILINLESTVDRLNQTDPPLCQGSISLESLQHTLSNLRINPRKCLINVANNHSGDLGKEGIFKEQEWISSIGAVPIGAAMYKGEQRGIITKLVTRCGTIGVVSWTRWLNNSKVNKQTPVFREEDVIGVNWSKVKEEHGIDVLIGYPHWEFDRSYIPTPETCSRAYGLLREGNFDVIVGHGPHVLQNIEIVDGKKLVAYSVGNICSERSRWDTHLGGMFEIDINSKGVEGYELYPIVQERISTGQIILTPLQCTLDTENRNKYRERIQTLFNLTRQVNREDTSFLPCYRIRVTTAKEAGSGTQSRAFITFEGTLGKTSEFELAGNLSEGLFSSGSVDDFFLQPTIDIGDIKSIKIRMEPSGFFSGWKLAQVEIVNIYNNQDWVFPCHSWFNNDTLERTLTPIIAQEPYKGIDDILAQVKTGDLLLFAGNWFTSAIIRTTIDSPYSHVAVVVVEETPEKGRTVLCYESTSRSYCWDIKHRDKWYTGVHCFLAKERIGSYDGKAWWLPLQSKLEESAEEKLIRFLNDRHMDKSNFNLKSMLKIGFGHLAPGVTIDTKIDLSTFFCSELAAMSFQEAGILSNAISASLFTPADMINLKLFGGKTPTPLKWQRTPFFKDDKVIQMK